MNIEAVPEFRYGFLILRIIVLKLVSEYLDKIMVSNQSTGDTLIKGQLY